MAQILAASPDKSHPYVLILVMTEMYLFGHLAIVIIDQIT